MKNSSNQKTVDDYLAALPLPVKNCLQQLRETILSAAPGAEEVISYQIPTYKKGGPLVHFAAFAKHCSLVVVNKDIIKTFAAELANFKTSGTTIQFTPEQPLPASLVKKVVKRRIEENNARAAAKEIAGKKPRKSVS
jgi:uncharacterized protein YdhG (YjbR/CyaY superfamily)